MGEQPQTIESPVAGRDIELRDPAEALPHDAQQRLRRYLEAEAIGMLTFDVRSGVLLDANGAFLKMSGYTREDVSSGRLDWQTMTPHEWYDVSVRQLERLEATGKIGPYEKEYFRKDGSRAWMLFSGRELGDGTLAEYAVDISRYKQAEFELRANADRQTFLVKLSDALRLLTTSADIYATAAHLLGEHLQLNRCRFADIEREEAVTRAEYTTDVPPMPTQFKYTELGHAVATAFRRGDPIVVTNAKYDPRFDVIERERLLAAQIVSFVAVLQVKNGRSDSALICHSATPRDWTAHEITLMREAGKRTWTAVDHAEVNAALATTQQALQSFYDTTPFMMGIGEIVGDRCMIISANRKSAEYFGEARQKLSGQSGRQDGATTQPDALWLKYLRVSQQEGRAVQFDYEDTRLQQASWLSVTVAIIGIGPTGRTRYSFVAEAHSHCRDRESSIATAAGELSHDWPTSQRDQFQHVRHP